MKWSRLVLGGVIWAATYNLVWGVAWFSFMRAEWQAAFDALGKHMLWTPALWTVWVIVTLPLGAAVAAYVAGKESVLKASLVGSLAMWLIIAGGSDIAFVGMSIPARTIVLDTFTNLVAMLAAASAVSRALSAVVSGH
ncbi:MAG: hypothetical protein ACM3ZT_05295 [Bacillota bacterium]